MKGWTGFFVSSCFRRTKVSSRSLHLYSAACPLCSCCSTVCPRFFFFLAGLSCLSAWPESFWWSYFLSFVWVQLYQYWSYCPYREKWFPTGAARPNSIVECGPNLVAPEANWAVMLCFQVLVTHCNIHSYFQFSQYCCSWWRIPTYINE